MRQVKFRGKSNSGKWVYGSLVWTEGQQPQIHFPIFFKDDPKKLLKWDWVYVDKKTVGQFTGLLDKNDNEIYEGDILQMNGSAKLEVQFLHGGFGYCLMFGDFLFGGNSSFRFNPFDKDESFEVIGNIHDNEDLMPYN